MTDMLTPNLSYESYVMLLHAEMFHQEVDVHTENVTYDGAYIWTIRDEELVILFMNDKITIPFSEINKIVRSS